MDTKAFDKTIDVNLKGVLYCYRYAASQMIKQGKGGRIIGTLHFTSQRNTVLCKIGASSAAGKQGQQWLGAYAMSKFAVRGLIQSAGARRLQLD